MADAEQLDDGLETEAGFARGCPTPAIEQIAAYVEMGEQAPFLEHAADAPALRREVDARRRVEKQMSGKAYAAGIGPDQARQNIYQRRLAGTRPTEEGEHAGRRKQELGRQLEITEALFRHDVQHISAPHPSIDPSGKQFRSDEGDERQEESDDAEPQRGDVAARFLRRGIDRDRDRSRLARDIADEDDRGAELAQASREGEDGTHQDARQGERQGDAEEGVERPGA